MFVDEIRVSKKLALSYIKGKESCQLCGAVQQVIENKRNKFS
jgi:hypothetical protein